MTYNLRLMTRSPLPPFGSWALLGLLVWSASGCAFVRSTGKLSQSDQVQVGGAAVSLDAVRALLHSDERVAAAEVLALPDPRWGARLVAFVVPAGAGRALDPGALGEALARTAQDTLGRPARPRTVRIVDALPLGASGKVDPAALAALAGQRPDGVRP